MSQAEFLSSKGVALCNPMALSIASNLFITGYLRVTGLTSSPITLILQSNLWPLIRRHTGHRTRTTRGLLTTSST
jgi:hypothetical protein